MITPTRAKAPTTTGALFTWCGSTDSVVAVVFSAGGGGGGCAGAGLAGRASP